MNGKPLVSFCLKAYNQMDYIGEALAGALAQTYRPLEIVICDDHSTDGTWEVLQREIAVRRDGLRDVALVLHRNEVNLGNVRNWEMCGKLAHGELLIKADGDDISLPERTEKVVAAWVSGGKRAKVITHAVRTLPGERIIADRSARFPLGAGMAWTKDCFDGWPEIGDDCARTYDDVVYSLRGLLLGSDLSIPDCLVRYRVGSGETSVNGTYRRPYARSVEGVLAASPQKRRDLAFAYAQGWLDRERYDAFLRQLAADDWRNGELRVLLSESAGFVRKARALCRIRTEFNWRGRLVFGLFTLPPGISEHLMRWTLAAREWIRK